ncbi:MULTISPECIES: phosphopantetheine-binding protein [unclassified Amycolatopsis]|uniref:phosphopantetheine-binding protein n=1 Tax=unclassified Amycolatopsis TaxID=2618356 RepID=UPI000CD02D52|nr:phosphopantetheine-binding protein [Amycolatopsis sp. CA-126428]
MSPSDDVERTLAQLITKVSGTDPVAMAAERPLTGLSLRDELDIDSLAMVELTDEIELSYGLTIPEEGLHLLQTFGDVADYLRAAA